MKIKTLLLSTLFWLTLSNQLLSQTDYPSTIQNERKLKNQEFKNAGTSPLTPAQIKIFTGLEYFGINANAKIEGDFTPEPPGTEVNLETTSGTNIKLVKYGIVSFTWDGKQYKFDVFQNKNLPEFGSDNTILFVPFTDPTNSTETFGKGRYVRITLPASGNKVVLDFNRAENPYNAYNSKFVSVVAPLGNKMLSAMTTGERKFEDRVK